MGTTTAGSDGMGGPLRVLVVDGDEAVAGTAATFLEHVDDGLAVESETEPRRALGRLERERFDCVVSAFHFPHSDGLAFCDRVAERAPSIGRVLFTTAATTALRERARERGLGFLAKGGVADQYEELAAQIRGQVGTHRPRV